MFYLQVTWTRGRRQISSRWRRSRGPESTRSSIERVVKCTLSDPLDGWHVAEQGSMDLHRTAATFRDHPIFHRMAAIVRDLGDTQSLLVCLISITWTAANRADHEDRADHDRLDLHQTATIVRNHGDARGAILISGSSSDGRDLLRWEHRMDRDLIFIGRFRSFVEELHDHGLIGPRSGNLHGGIAANRADVDRRMTRTTIVARLWRNRGPIAARSWPDRG